MKDALTPAFNVSCFADIIYYSCKHPGAKYRPFKAEPQLTRHILPISTTSRSRIQVVIYLQGYQPTRELHQK
jgi:hypothetical protein